ncbi:glycosyltransferase [Symbiopectobacterium purcellii]|uniref:Glycosyltransferase n=1 Tax=Symbiopectobacterium purcellii TaxID=2871826 RepID=A0ABX9APU1_9ENTR|nr:glycosyltransferase [Symbiopectobacterium purcellii]QZN97073.1 glycosyltransferase [Symbiopectobacterium purcellii]
MKIAIFIPNFLQGGAETVMVNIANYMADMGHQIDLIVAENRGPLKDIVSEKININNLNCGRVIFSLPKLVFYFLNKKPDVFFSTLKENNVVAILASIISLSKAKVVIREANTLSEEFSRESKLLQKIKLFLVKFLYPRADRVVALSFHMKNDIDNFLAIDSKKIKVIYNPVNIERLDELSKVDCIKGNPILNPAVKNIVSVARLYKSKGYDTILHALSLLKKKGHQFHFYAVGDGPENEDLVRLTDELQLSDCVSFLGFKKNPFSILSNADCFVLASHYEGMPNSLLQAMALNIPIICSDSPGASSEVLERGKFGYLFPVNDYECLSKLLDKLFSNDKAKVDTRTIIIKNHNADRIMQEYTTTLTSWD